MFNITEEELKIANKVAAAFLQPFLFTIMKKSFEGLTVNENIQNGILENERSHSVQNTVDVLKNNVMNHEDHNKEISISKNLHLNYFHEEQKVNNYSDDDTPPSQEDPNDVIVDIENVILEDLEDCSTFEDVLELVNCRVF